MPLPKVDYTDYLRVAHENSLRFLHDPDELPLHRTDKALWQCLVTGLPFARSYHHVLADPYPSPGQMYWAQYGHLYRETADKLGIEFVFDETVDLAPGSTKQPVKWRGKSGRIVVTDLASLAYRPITKKLKEQLGLADHG